MPLLTGRILPTEDAAEETATDLTEDAATSISLEEKEVTINAASKES